jgi:hypothetical protein
MARLKVDGLFLETNIRVAAAKWAIQIFLHFNFPERHTHLIENK